MAPTAIDTRETAPVIDASRALDRRLMRWLLAIGLLSGLLYVALPHFSDVQQYCEEERIAIHLARGEGFLSPFDLSASSPPTSWCPPVYPGIIAAVYRLFGVRTSASVMTLMLLQVVPRTAAAGAVLLIGKEWFSRTTGVIGAAMILLHPLFLRALGFSWDNYLALAMFLWLLFWAIRLGREHAGMIQAANLGIGMGLLMLTNTAYALTLLPLACIAAGIGAPRVNEEPQTSSHRAAGRRVGFICMVALGGAASLAPWTMRNYLTFDRLFFVRANLNTELWIGNVPDSTGWMTLETLNHHPSRDPLQQGEILEEGEIRYFQACGKRFAAEYHAAPAHFWALCADRWIFALVGFPFSEARYPLLLNFRWHFVAIDPMLFRLFFTLLGVAGAWKGWRGGRRGGMFLLLLGCLSTAPYTFTQMCDRYTLPVNAMLVLPAAYFVTLLCQRVWNSRLRWAEFPPAMCRPKAAPGN